LHHFLPTDLDSSLDLPESKTAGFPKLFGGNTDKPKGLVVSLSG
jgi:hypothetical protein